MSRAPFSTGPQHALLASVLGQLPHAVAAFDRALRCDYANANWPTFADAVATPASAFPSNDELRHAAQDCLQTGKTIQLAGQRYPADDGATCWDVTVAPLRDADAITGVLCVAEDATARMQAEQAAAAQARLAAFRNAVSQSLASSDDVDIVLQDVAAAMVRHAPGVFARIWVFDPAEDAFRLRASAGLHTRLNGTYARIPAAWIRERTFTGPNPELARDIQLTHAIREPDWAAEHGINAMASHPLLVRGQVIGIMLLWARQNLDADTLNELAAIADAVAQFLERKRAEAALRERELLFRSVFEAAADGLLISDLETGQVLEANPALCGMLGYSRAELTELRRGALIQADTQRAPAETGAEPPAVAPAREQALAVRNDGSTFPVDARSSQIPYQSRPAQLSAVRDITHELEAQQLLERRVAERTQELHTLLEISRSIALAAQLEPLFELIFDQLRLLIDYEAVAIGLVDGDVYTTVAVRRDALGQQSLNPLGSQVPIARDAFIWRELSAGRPLYSPDIYGADAFSTGFRALFADRLSTTYAHVCSLVAAPLIVANELIGAMYISSVQADRFQPHDIDLLLATANQIAIAIANARLHEQARAGAALAERQRLARELHDSVSQALFGIGLGAETARSLIERDPAKAVAPLDYVLQLARGGMAEMRALIFELRPESLKQEGLVAALEKQAAATRARHALAVELALPDEPDIPLEVKEALYRIAQEAMHNTVKHAQATTITLALDRDDDALALDISDNGVGFDATDSFPGHLGLVSMRERVARYGGSVTIDSAPGQGTRVQVSVPLPAARQA